MPGQPLPSYIIRHGGLDDCAPALRLWHDAGATPSATDTVEHLHQLLLSDGGILLVAEERGRLIGTVIAGWDGWRGNIYRLAVLPGNRRRGVATALVRAAEDEMRARGAVRLSVLAERHDEQATAFWDSLAASGYSADPRMARYVKTLGPG